jgi:prepilin-type N-terminal cleavage/methylation domain-containing protein
MKQKMGEKGFTLIELLVGITIAAVIVGAASMTVVTMMRLTPQTNNWAIALRQVQNAGYWISHDVQMSQGEITPGDGNPIFLTMLVPYESGGTIETKEIVYQFEDMPGGLQRLTRDDAGQQIMIAEYIISGETAYDDTDGIPTVTITAASGDVKVTKRYEAMQRVPPVPSP